MAMKQIATNLRRLRLEKGLTQDRLAEALGLPQSLISGYENKVKPSLENLTKLASFYGVSVDSILMEPTQLEVSA